jgi:superoxide reductase
MKNRRDFMKTSLVASASVLAASVLPASAADNTKANIFAYSKANPGRWAGKEGSHAPVVTVEGNKVTIETKHGMTEGHYIVKHTLITGTGEVLGESFFFPTDAKAISTFEIKGSHKTLFALSFCNLHDLWVTEFSV